MFRLSVPTNETQRINVEFGKFCIPSGYFSELHPMEDMGIFGEYMDLALLCSQS